MKKLPFGKEGILLSLLLAGLAVSVVLAVRQVSASRNRLSARAWALPAQERPPPVLDFEALAASVQAAEHPFQTAPDGRGLLASEVRVAAVGSAYPIPYEAEVCPYSKIPQPSMNQLDRDADGITDDWELLYGLDKYSAADAAGDLDGDGFTNLEEFVGGTGPNAPLSHPPYALKLRFVERKEIPFPMVYQGFSELPGNRRVFQLNTPADGKTHFRALGESAEGFVLQRFIPAEGEVAGRLVVVRGDVEVVLERGRIAADPESQAELINILDRSKEIVTMDALLSLRDDEYMVLGVYPDKVTVKHLETGKMYDIVGSAEEVLESASEDL
ncbi:Amuc_1099 family pilus-like system protein [Pontiella sulfatireligans]|uniref:Uncharacterized protein n=1 Tax=Pontiella sulfatireligans TaxID=2750658 RepID=A0A6C2UQL3_9BACT|nr:Amuc_1099 family pilus-like system protein [Pontiella sulfatireligans]VGO21587.1 hypothetical protein SCARR_03661 [Pontiella sulfatireligans]